MTMPINAEATVARAAELAAKLKPGTYDAVQALALLSIAQSFTRIASALESRVPTEEM